MDKAERLVKARAARGSSTIKKTQKASKSGFRKPGQVFTHKAAIRSFCISCMGGGEDGIPATDIRECTGYNCALYPYRMGSVDVKTIKEEMKNGKFTR